MNTPKISVIVPVYNSEAYLERCIKSIVNQTYKNLEIILVDDGSPDGSAQICDEWAKKDDRIVVIHKPNGGVADVQNVGIEKSTGDFISIVDGDDFIADSYMETLLNLCVEHECDIAQCDYIHVYNDDIIPCTREENVRVFNNVEMLYKYYTELFCQTVVAWGKIYRKHLFEKIRYPVGVFLEDDATTYKIIYEANKIAVSNKRLYMYYQNPDSIMGRKYSRKRLDVIWILEEQIRFFEDKKLHEHKKLATLRYCSVILDAYHNSQKYIPDCQDILKDLKCKFRWAYKRVLFSKHATAKYKIWLLMYRFTPWMLKLLKKEYASPQERF